MSGVINLLTEALRMAEVTMSKAPDWKQRKKDLYYKKLARYEKLKTMDRRRRSDQELQECEDDLALFIRAYREDLKDD
jgi:hypothetical protein